MLLLAGLLLIGAVVACVFEPAQRARSGGARATLSVRRPARAGRCGCGSLGPDSRVRHRRWPSPGQTDSGLARPRRRRGSGQGHRGQRPGRTVLHQHDQPAGGDRSEDRQGRVGEALRGPLLRSPGRLSRRTDDLCARVRQPEVVCDCRGDRRSARGDRRRPAGRARRSIRATARARIWPPGSRGRSRSATRPVMRSSRRSVRSAPRCVRLP